MVTNAFQLANFMIQIRTIHATALKSLKAAIKTVRIVSGFLKCLLKVLDKLWKFLIRMKDPYCEIIGQPCKNNHTCTSNSKITDTEKDYSCKCEFGYNDNDKNCTCNTGIRIQESAKTDCSICKWHF